VLILELNSNHDAPLRCSLQEISLNACENIREDAPLEQVKKKPFGYDRLRSGYRTLGCGIQEPEDQRQMRSGKKILTNVCINQNDLVEQVPLMGDVYGFAEEVSSGSARLTVSRALRHLNRNMFEELSRYRWKKFWNSFPVFLEQAQTPLHKIPHCCLGEFSGFEALHL
jgi:hypothetical protein